MTEKEIIQSIEEIGGISVECNDYNHSNMAGYEIKTNKQIIRILIDDSPGCCEHWGYFSTNDNIKDFIGGELISLALTDTALNEKIVKDNGADSSSLDCGGIMFVNFNTNLGLLQFAVYNAHNGYYGHSVVVESNQLKHETSL